MQNSNTGKKLGFANGREKENMTITEKLKAVGGTGYSNRFLLVLVEIPNHSKID